MVERHRHHHEVDYDLCVGECVKSCPVDVYKLVDGKATEPKVEDSMECFACVEACPVKAIKHSSC